MKKQRKPADEASRETYRPRAFTPAVDLSEYAREADQSIRARAPISDVRIALGQPGDVDVDVQIEGCDEVAGEELYWTVIGAPDSIPHLAISLDALRDQALDSAAGFVVSQVDGASTVQDLIDVCSLPRIDLLRILCELAQAGVVTFLA